MPPPPDRRNTASSDSTLVTLFVLVGFAAVFLMVAWNFSALHMALFLCAIVLALICLQNYLLGLLILLFAMMFSPEIDGPGGIVLRAEDVLIPLLALGILAKVVLPRFGAQLRRSPLDRPILFFIVIHAVASMRGAIAGYVAPLDTLSWNLKLIEFFFVYWLAFHFIRKPEHVVRYMNIAIMILVGVAIYATFQIPKTEIYTVNRLSAPFEGQAEPTTLGGYLTLLLGLVSALAIYEPKRIHKCFYIALCVFVLVAIAYTLSRTTYVSCVIMMVAISLVTRRYKLLAGIIIFLMLSPMILPDEIIARIMSTFDDTRPHGLDPSLMERIDVWSKVSYNLKRHLFLGHGVTYLQILDSQFARTLIEAGIFGLISILWIFAACYRMGRRVLSRATQPKEKALAAGYVVGVIAILVHALGTITFYILRIMEPFWFLTGIVASLDVYYRAKLREQAKT